jgi:hypothetical protein
MEWRPLLLVGMATSTNSVGESVSQRAYLRQSRFPNNTLYTHNDGEVDVGSLLDGLSVGAGVGHNDQARLLERAGDVIGEVTWGETTSDGDGTSVGGELEDSTLAIGTGGDDANYSN